jgi:Ca2+-binding EF-hand superfamily protein
MASKFRTSHTIPPEFPEVLKDFVREILREQPQNIFAFGADYFRAKASEVGGGGGGMNADDLVEQLTTLFLQSDVDGNGVLDKREFKRLMQEANLGLTKKQIKLLYSQADVNDDGSIEYREFIPACVEVILSIQARDEARAMREQQETEAYEQAAYFFHGMSSEEMEYLVREAFNAADVDGSGELDMKEFQTFLRDLPLNLTKNEINMAMMEVDANQDGKVSLEEFLPLFHVLMQEMIKAQILQVNRAPDELASWLISCCQQYDAEGTGYLKEQKVARAIRDADLGLTKFQILSIMGEATVGAHGIEYEAFIADTASAMIQALINVEDSIQFKRTEAWKQMQAAEEEAENVLGMPRDEFAQAMTSVFQEYDADKSGCLDPAEFQGALSNCGIPFNETQIRMLMSAADLNEDGLIEYSEFASVAVQLMEYVQREARMQEMMGSVE